MRAITADQVASKDLNGLSAAEIYCHRPHSVLILLKLEHRRAGQHAQVGCRGRTGEQHRLEVDLIDTMRWLGRWPPSIWASFRGIAFGATGDRNARELEA